MLGRLRRRDPIAIMLLVLATLAASVAAAAPPATASNAATVIAFEKRWIEPGHYLGTTSPGTIEMWVDDVSFAGNVQKFTATLQLSLGARSLTAILEGQFNFTTARVVLNGVVVDGWLAGAHVHEESRYIGDDPETGGPIFAGTVQLMPASA